MLRQRWSTSSRLIHSIVAHRPVPRSIRTALFQGATTRNFSATAGRLKPQTILPAARRFFSSTSHSMSAPSSAAGTDGAPVAVAPPSPTAPPSLFVILGCTGAGKTALSVSVARRYDAEVLSADSIQVYAGLPLASNQLTPAEAQGVRHHMLAVLPPHRAMHVRQFRRAARALIADAFRRGRSVVVVGGTFYWMENILYKNIMAMEEEGEGEGEEAGSANDDDGMESDAEGTSVSAAATHSQSQSQQHADAPFIMPSDAPLTLEALQSLTTTSIPALSLDHLAFACSVLLSRMGTLAVAPDALHGPAAAALLRHLGQGMSADEFRQLLATMPLEDVRSARFVSHILASLSQDSEAAAGVAASSSASVAAAHASVSDATASATPATLAVPMFPSAHVYEVVALVDPVVGQKLHPRDERKLRRALAIFVEQGGRATMSELIARTGGPRGRAGLQYRVQALWVDCDPHVLESRLDSRVDSMVRGGLLQEAEGMYRHLWLRQQRLARGEAAEEPWEYNNELDAGCTICARVESRDVSLPAASSAAASSADATAAASSSAALAAAPALSTDSGATAPASVHPDYLGPSELQMDWERGIGQALGLKEFRPYFKLKFHTLPEDVVKEGTSAGSTPPRSKRQKTAAAAAPLDPEAAAAAARVAALQSCFDMCVQSLKQRTRSYARVQLRWIKTRFWPGSVATLPDAPADSEAGAATPSSQSASGQPAASAEGALSILRLDSSGAADPAVWEREVVAPALQVCDQFMSGQRVDLRPYAALAARLPPIPIAAPADAIANGAGAEGSGGGPAVWTKHRCGVCDVVCNGSLEWTKHQSSKRHRTASTRTQRKQQQMDRMEEVQRARLEKKKAAEAVAQAAAQAETSSGATSSS